MIKTQKQREAIQSDRIRLLFLTGVLLSFLGWIWEMLLAAFILQIPNDRGFLTLPLCPIYGFSLIGMYLIFGTPQAFHIFGKKLSLSPFLCYLCYFICSVLVATAFELLTGFFFDTFFDVFLWNYTGLWGNIGGYIAFFPSLGWGLAITVFMSTGFLKLYHFTDQYTKKSRKMLFYALLFLIIFDFIFNILFLCQYGTWFNLNPLFQ